MTTDAGHYVFSELAPPYNREEPVQEDIPECINYFMAVAAREIDKLKNLFETDG